jgi:hypothetical protein
MNYQRIQLLQNLQQLLPMAKPTQVDHYILDAIISVGYRVNSAQATQFRIWATNTLREFIVKGFRARRRAPQAQQAIRRGLRI